MAYILNLPFPYVCGLFHQEFAGITIIRLDRNPGSAALPCLELANDIRHIYGLRCQGTAGRREPQGPD